MWAQCGQIKRHIYSYFSNLNLQQSNMHFQLALISLFAVCFAAAQDPQIIDFTYTQLLIESNYTGIYTDKINITPDTLHLEQYQFPQVCDLKEMLNEGAGSSGTVDKFINSDDYLSSLRVKILNLLKLAQQIKNSRSYLSEIKKHLKFGDESSSVGKYKSQLQSLARKESLLWENKKKIEDLTQLLEGKIKSYNNNPKNEQFKAASLHFQIENYKTKIVYLKQLKQKSISTASKQKDNNYNEFFNSLGLDLLTESQQIQFIDKYFQNMSHIKYLKEMADSLKDNIEVDRLNIQYKKSCEREKIDLKSKGSSHDEIKETLEHLRQKKKQLGNNTNKYCQGVALKLEMQIKRLLKAVNWTFSCADGLKELQLRLEEQLKSLKAVEAQLSKYKEGGFQDYQKDFIRTKTAIQSKLEKLKSFTINQYTHQPVELEKIINQTEKLKIQAEEKLLKLPKQVNGDQNIGQIKELADQIKKEKANFCHQFNTYQKERSKIWLEIYEFQNTIRYASQMRSEYIKESQKLEELESYYKEIGELVITQIQANYSVQ